MNIMHIIYIIFCSNLVQCYKLLCFSFTSKGTWLHVLTMANTKPNGKYYNTIEYQILPSTLAKYKFNIFKLKLLFLNFSPLNSLAF